MILTKINVYKFCISLLQKLMREKEENIKKLRQMDIISLNNIYQFLCEKKKEIKLIKYIYKLNIFVKQVRIENDLI